MTDARTVGLVDDHDIVAVAVESTVSRLDGLRFVGAARTVNELLALGPTPALVLLDLRLADGSSPSANVERLGQAGADVLAFTSGENPYLVRLAARTPVLGIVRKSESVAVLEAALRMAGAGQPVVSAEWAAALDTDPELSSVGLSPQEEKVLSLFASGVKSQVVASEIGIAVGTVDDYVRRIRQKYARAQRPAHTKVDLYKRAVEDGFLPLPSDTPERG